MGAVFEKCIGAVDEFEVKAAMKKGFNATTKSNYLEPSQLRPAVRLALDFVGPLGGRVSDEMIDAHVTQHGQAAGKTGRKQFESLVWPLVEGAGGPKQGLGRSHSSARASGACAPPPPPTGVAAERPVAVI